MIRLYLVRHGQTEYNIQGRIQGQGDSALTPLGISQAKAISRRLAAERFDAVYSSDLGRAMRTAEIVAAPHNLPVRPTPLLREISFGLLEGLTQAEIDERYPEDHYDWRHHRPPGAEVDAEVIERCRRFATELIQSHDDGSQVLAICHGGSLRRLIVGVCELPPPVMHRLHLSNASLSILEIGDFSSIWCLNDTSHLVGVAVTDADADAENDK